MAGHYLNAVERGDCPICLSRLTGYLDRRALIEIGDINIEGDCAIFVEFDSGHFAVRHQ
jgi:hypothetical protein